MLHFRNPMRSEQRERSLGIPDKAKSRRANDTFAPRRYRGAMKQALASLAIPSLKSQIPNKNLSRIHGATKKLFVLCVKNNSVISAHSVVQKINLRKKF